MKLNNHNIFNLKLKKSESVADIFSLSRPIEKKSKKKNGNKINKI